MSDCLVPRLRPALRHQATFNTSIPHTHNRNHSIRVRVILLPLSIFRPCTHTLDNVRFIVSSDGGSALYNISQLPRFRHQYIVLCKVYELHGHLVHQFIPLSFFKTLRVYRVFNNFIAHQYHFGPLGSISLVLDALSFTFTSACCLQQYIFTFSRSWASLWLTIRHH